SEMHQQAEAAAQAQVQDLQERIAGIEALAEQNSHAASEQFAQSLSAERQKLQAQADELDQLRTRCLELTRKSELHEQAEAAAQAQVQELQERIAAIEAFAEQNSHAASEQFTQSLDAERQKLQAQADELDQLQTRCQELTRKSELHEQAEAAAQATVSELQ